MNLVQMTAKLYDARDSARALLGDGYDAKIREFAKAIDDVANGKGINRIAAMILICETAIEAGYPLSAMYAMAACVDLVEQQATEAGA